MSYSGSSGSSRISTAADSALSNIANGDVLAYNASIQKWTNTALAAGDAYASNPQATGSYTLVLADAGKVIENTGTSALTITVPSNASVPYPIGTTIELLNYSTGSIVLAGATSAANVATDTFTGSDGSAWASQWSSQALSGASAEASIQGNSGRITTGTTAYASLRQYLSTMPVQTNTDFSFTFKIGAQVDSYLWVSICADNTLAANQSNLSQNCYAVLLHTNPTSTNGTYEVYSIVNNGALTTFGTGGTNIVANVSYGFRFQRQGTTIRFRVWDVAGNEPSTWTYSGNDTGTQPPAGRVSVAYGNANDTTSRYADFDSVVVGSSNGSSVALRSVAGLRLTSQYAPAAIRKRAADEWIITGATVV